MPRGKSLAERLMEVRTAAVWNKVRVPAMIAGGVVLLVLILVLVYSLWEKPPATNTDGLNPTMTIKPAVTEPVTSPLVTPSDVPSATPSPEPSPEETPLSHTRKEDCYTFVILAFDQQQANTDTVLVGKLDTADKTLNFVNVPRDTLVNVSWGVKKINTVLVSERNDPERFLEHLSHLLGFTVDCYAVIDLQAVEKLVDCVGGVYYNVPRDMDYDDPSQDLSIHIAKGYQQLSGADVVKVLRFRLGNDNTGYANGDLGRITTQQDLLMTMAAQFLKLGNIPNLGEALEIFQTYVKTDLTVNNIAFFAREFLRLDKEKISFSTVPGDAAYIRSGSYYEIDIEPWVEMVNEKLNPYVEAVTVENMDILQYMDAATGAQSTGGDVFPISSFYDFSQYTG